MTKINKKKFIFSLLATVFSIAAIGVFSFDTKEVDASRKAWDWLNDDFWAWNPSEDNIKYALYWDWTPGSSPYNDNWTGWCVPTNFEYINSWYDLDNLWTLNNDTIYIIEDWNYQLDTGLYMWECSALIGYGEVNITQTYSGTIRAMSKNTIVDNLNIIWSWKNETARSGWYAWIYIRGWNSTINNVKTSNHLIWILTRTKWKNIINNIETFDNYSYWLCIWSHSDHNLINKINAYGNNVWIEISANSKNIIQNSQTYNNIKYWIEIENWNYNIINNVQSYNNECSWSDWAWILLDWDSNHNTFNNIQSYKNGKNWIRTNWTWDYNTFNNIVVYNNLYDWIWIWYTNKSNYSNNNYFNNISSYNNHGTGILLFYSTWSSYYWTIKSFWNLGTEIWIANNSSRLKWTSSTSWLWRSAWSIDTWEETMSYLWVTNPVNNFWSQLLDNHTIIWRSWDRLAYQPIKYIFWKNILKQIQPVKYNDSNQLGLWGTESVDRDPDEYIATVNMERTQEEDELVEYYFWQNSEFTRNREENNCSLWAITVKYINDQQDCNEILWTTPWVLWHSIYIFGNWWYGFNEELSVEDNCIAFVNKWDGAKLKRLLNNSSPIIKTYWVENIILDNISIYWNWTSNYWIYLWEDGENYSKNNTINNVQSFNHKTDGIVIGTKASNNTIMNTQTWNNGENGINIQYAGVSNTINNSIAYNNWKNGLMFGNWSKNNTINNGQFFNNDIGGIFTDFNTQQNIINNVHIYNNDWYWINFKRSSWNSLNNLYIYNNKTGINIIDTSCVNNTYSETLKLFANDTDMAWTTWNDEILAPSTMSFDSEWWDVGELITGNESMNCAWVTNPRNIMNITNWFLSWTLNCAERWVQTEWNPTDHRAIDYMFGLSINTQNFPVWYISGAMTVLNNQYIEESYVWEINPIIRTNPGNINFYNISGTNNLELNTIYGFDINYSSGTINHDFDIELFADDDVFAYIALNTWNGLIDIWTWSTNIPFDQIESLKLMIETANAYRTSVTGILMIWTDEYGSWEVEFTFTTKANPLPPSITWVDNILTGGFWYENADTWKATVDWVDGHDIDVRAAYVTWASNCNSWIAIWSVYNQTTVDISLNPDYNSLNEKYVCIYAKDNDNWKSTTALSNQILISKVEFIDDIQAGPVHYDTVDINFQNVYEYGYRRVTSISECDEDLEAFSLLEYNDAFVINDGNMLNRKYICAYAEDINGSWMYFPSANDVNIIDYSSSVRFLDAVSSVWVDSDRIEVFLNSDILFSYKKYKRVENVVDCQNTEWTLNYTWAIVLTTEDHNNKYFCLYTKEQNSGVENYLISDYKVKIDNTEPTTPSIDDPEVGDQVYFLTLVTNWASDRESGLAGFYYEIAENATFLDVLAEGIHYTSDQSFSPEFDEEEGNYAMRIKAVDKVWNESNRSNIVTFDYKNLDDFEFENIEKADLDQEYTSNKITMWWLETNEVILATVSKWTLYRNWKLLGSSGLVQNADELSIEMISSSNEDTTVETELKIANRVVPWTITTVWDGESSSDWDYDLSTSEMLAVIAIFNSIIDTYDDPAERANFLWTMKKMLEDNIELSDWDTDNLKYLLELINDYLDEEFDDNETWPIHTALNCKEYSVKYDSDKDAYFSPTMLNRVYFGSRTDLIKFIDSKNPWDCHVNTYWDSTYYENEDDDRHIAPNGKVYDIKLNELGHYSPDFTQTKYFASADSLRNYIDKNNPVIIVWNHEIDEEFEPKFHTAPNGKEYKIYKTSRWFMSYKLLNVRYYSSLEELKNYIDKNNP